MNLIHDTQDEKFTISYSSYFSLKSITWHSLSTILQDQVWYHHLDVSRLFAQTFLSQLPIEIYLKAGQKTTKFRRMMNLQTRA